ncbi:hypothetical protein ACFO9E_22020 [Streptomyces maoxianensis]|uniref:Uncharacterized protein n=1 Tax=Streptomyces maoxianensis TaxID=1459942 RepID=A0ABV9G876_9ACTN
MARAPGERRRAIGLARPGARRGRGFAGRSVLPDHATDRAHRIGSLVFNFGGPGGSGFDQLAGGSAAQFKKLGTRYDLVSFDPPRSHLDARPGQHMTGGPPGLTAGQPRTKIFTSLLDLTQFAQTATIPA